MVAGKTSAFQRDVKKQSDSAAKSMTGTFSTAFKKIGALATAAFGVKAITDFSKECIALGSDLTEVQNVVDVTFGQGAEKINAFAKNAPRAFGVAEKSAKQYSGTMGAMLKSMGLSTVTALDMSTAITKLTGDMASFYNLDTDTAFEKIRSGISGETEPLKQLGINMSVANLEAYALSQGITTAYNKISQSNQALLRYNYLMSVTKDAQGDFERTSDSWANQVRILKLNFDSLKSSIGQMLISVLTPLLINLNKLISYANEAVSALQRLFNGGESNTATTSLNNVSSAAVTAVSDMTDTQKAAEKTAKKINTAFASVDEIHTLGAKDTSSAGTDKGDVGGAVGSTVGTANNELTKTETKINSIKSKLKNFWKGFSSGFTKEKNSIKTTLEKLKGDFKRVWTDIKSLGSPISQWANGDLLKCLNVTGVTALKILGGFLSSAEMMFSDFWDYGVFPVLQGFITTGLPLITQFSTEMQTTLWLTFQEIKTLFDDVWRDFAPSALSSFSTVFTDIMSVLFSTWQQYGQPIFSGVNDGITGIVGLFSNAWNSYLKPIFDELKTTFDEIWRDHLKPLYENISQLVSEFIVAALDIYNCFILPIISFFQQQLYPIIARVVKNIINIVQETVTYFIDSFNNLITVLKGVVQFISGVLTGDWKKAWTGIKNIFSGIWEQIKLIFKTPINFLIAGLENLANNAITVINSIISGINKFKKDKISLVADVKLPRLAQGGYFRANSPQLAIVGDNKREGEITTPESKIREQVELAIRSAGNTVSNSQLGAIVKQAIMDAIKEIGNIFGGDWTIIIVDENGNTKAAEVISAAQRANRRSGKTVITLGV